MMLYQYHLIARCDDAANVAICVFLGHADPHFSSFALETHVYWSKNVHAERDCPNQIFLGAVDVDYCLLLALGFYQILYRHVEFDFDVFRRNSPFCASTSSTHNHCVYLSLTSLHML